MTNFRNSPFCSLLANTSSQFASHSIVSTVAMNLGSFMGTGHSTLNRMPHQRIRETARDSVATPSVSEPEPTHEQMGYETNLEDLNMFARYDEVCERTSENPCSPLLEPTRHTRTHCPLFFSWHILGVVSVSSQLFQFAVRL